MEAAPNCNDDPLSLCVVLSQRLLSESLSIHSKMQTASVLSRFINLQQFATALSLSSSSTSSNCLADIQQQLKSKHFKLCEICVQLLVFPQPEVHRFGMALFEKLTGHNLVLGAMMMALCLSTASDFVPDSLLGDDDMQTEYKLRAAVAVIKRCEQLLQAHEEWKHCFSRKLFELRALFVLMSYSLCLLPNGRYLDWRAKPYKVPSFETQKILIEFWAEHNLFPAESDFRCVYLVRWLATFPKTPHISAVESSDLCRKLLGVIDVNSMNEKEQLQTLLTIMHHLCADGMCKHAQRDKDTCTPSQSLFLLMEQIPITVQTVQLVDEHFDDLFKRAKAKRFTLMVLRILRWIKFHEQTSINVRLLLKMILSKLNVHNRWDLDTVLANRFWFAIDDMLQQYQRYGSTRERGTIKGALCSSESMQDEHEGIMVAAEDPAGTDSTVDQSKQQRKKGKIVRVDKVRDCGYVEQIGGINHGEKYKFEFKDFRRYSLLKKVAKLYKLKGLRVEFEVKILNQYNDCREVKCVAVNLDLDIVFHEVSSRNMKKWRRRTEITKDELVELKNANTMQRALTNEEVFIDAITDCAVESK